MNISDIIEDFILKNFIEDSVQLSRNELAKYFQVSPSQINYVISTRFTTSRGYDTESKRGGDGYIKIYKLQEDKNDFLVSLLDSEYVKSLDMFTATQLLDNMLDRLIISQSEYDILKVVLSDKSLKSPFNVENIVRANIFRQFILNLLKGERL